MTPDSRRAGTASMNGAVFKGAAEAATLASEGRDTVFRYRADYSGPAVSSTLPLGKVEPHGGRGVPTYFANLLPEGRRLGALRNQVKTSVDDELSLLLAVGDTVGDVSVVPAGQQPVTTLPLVDLSASEGVVFGDVLAQHGFSDRVGLAGAQDKLSAGMITLPVRTVDHEAIIKINPPDYPRAVENEYYFLRLASRLGLPVSRARLIHDHAGEPGLVVDRFDRPTDGQRLAVEDGCQVLDLYPGDKYNVSAESLIEGLSTLCAARAVAVRTAVLQVCFAWLTGNGDLHAKNMSVLQTHDGEWRIAPMYDIPSTLPYRDHDLALPVGGRTSGLQRRHLIRFGESVGLRPAAAVRVLDHALRATAPLLDDLRAGALGFDANLTRDLVRQLGRRRRDCEA